MSIQRQVSVNLLLAVFSALCIAQNAQANSISWRTNLDNAKIEAGRTGKPLLLHFYSSSCAPCKTLDNNVFTQPQIAAAMERDYVPVKINTELSPAIAKSYGISRVPADVILSSQGKPLQKLSCPIEAQKYEAQLANVAHYFRQQSSGRKAITQAPMHSAYAGLNINRDHSARLTDSTLPTNNAQPSAKQPSVPVITTNPYVNASPPTSTNAKPTPTAVARPPLIQTPRTPSLASQQTPALPANAMPNSYRSPTPPIASTSAIRSPAQTVVPVASTPATSAVQQATANAPVVAKKAWPPELPTGAPALAFDGFCPVSLKETQKWIRGNQAFGAIHRNQTFLFASKRQQQQFLVSPDAYSPVFSGNDPVKLLDENIKTSGKRQFGCKHLGAFYLFSSKETMERFMSQPGKYSTAVRQAMERMDATADTVRR